MSVVVTWILLAMAIALSVIILWAAWNAADFLASRVEGNIGPWRLFGMQILWFALFLGLIWSMSALWRLVL